MKKNPILRNLERSLETLYQDHLAILADYHEEVGSPTALVRGLRWLREHHKWPYRLQGEDGAHSWIWVFGSSPDYNWILPYEFGTPGHTYRSCRGAIYAAARKIGKCLQEAEARAPMIEQARAAIAFALGGCWCCRAGALVYVDNLCVSCANAGWKTEHCQCSRCQALSPHAWKIRSSDGLEIQSCAVCALVSLRSPQTGSWHQCAWTLPFQE